MSTPIPQNSASFSLREVAEICHGTLNVSSGQARAIQLVDVQTDSRRIRSGSLFVALRGDKFDANRFLPQVASAGAGAALVSPDAQAPEGLPVVRVEDTLFALGQLARFHRRRWGGVIVGITGSAGKTTTKELTWAAWSAATTAGSIAKTSGNLNNLVGVPMTLFTLGDADRGAVIEMGTSRPGEIARLAGIVEPNHGVVTTVAVAHAQGLLSLAGVAREKADLLRALPQGGVAIYNRDCAPLVGEVRGLMGNRVSFGRADDADVRLVSSTPPDPDRGGKSIAVYQLSRDTLQVALAMPGEGPAVDAAAALAVVQVVGGQGSLPRAAEAMACVEPVSGRMMPRRGVAGCMLVDDTYNANPASVEVSLKSLAALAKQRGGRAFAVVADMGELGHHSSSQHRQVGTVCAELRLEGLVAVGPEMRAAALAARAAGLVDVVEVSDAMQVAKALAGKLTAADVVLVKGSRSMGMERAVDALAEAES